MRPKRCSIWGFTQAQPHFQPDVNAGSDEEPDIIIAPQPSPPGCTLPQSPANPAPASTSTDGVLRAAAAVGDAAQASNPMCSPFARGRAAARAAYARSLGQQGFMDLVAKLQAVYDEVGDTTPARALPFNNFVMCGAWRKHLIVHTTMSPCTFPCPLAGTRAVSPSGIHLAG